MHDVWSNHPRKKTPTFPRDQSMSGVLHLPRVLGVFHVQIRAELHVCLVGLLAEDLPLPLGIIVGGVGRAPDVEHRGVVEDQSARAVRQLGSRRVGGSHWMGCLQVVNLFTRGDHDTPAVAEIEGLVGGGEVARNWRRYPNLFSGEGDE